MNRSTFSRLVLFNSTFPQNLSSPNLNSKLEWNTEINGQLVNLQQELSKFSQ